MRKTTAKKMMLGIASTCFFVAGSMMAFAGTWQQTGAGWTYLKDNHQYANNELVTDNNQLYFLGADGIMKTGFVPVNGVYYYFTPAGNMQTGWVLDNNNWYYMQTDAAHFGQMTVNASQNVNGKNYYFGADGKMVHDTTIGQMTYGADGAAITYGQNVNNGYSNSVYTDGDADYADVADDVYAQFGDDDTLYLVGKNGSLTDFTHQAFSHDEYTQEILSFVNKERAKAGLSPLTLDNSLNQIAEKRANELTNNYSHDGFYNYKPTILNSYSVCGENIGFGQSMAVTVMKGWMNSSGHRTNILDSDFSSIGIGVVKSSVTGLIYYVQVFAG